MNNLGNKEVMARNIQYYLDLRNKDRSDLCKDLGFKYSTVSNWLQAVKYPRIDKIELMARYFGVTKADLVEDHNIAPSPVPAIALMELSPHEIHIALAYHEADDRDKAIVDMTLEPYIKEYVLRKFSKHYESFFRAIKYYYPHLSHDEAERLLMDIIRTPSLDLAIEQLETHYATDIVIKCIVKFYNNFTEYMENTPSLDKIKQFIYEYAPPKSP